MNAVLGGLFGSRINLNLREAHGYTYGASSFYDWRRGPGPFVVSTAVQSEVTAPALRMLIEYPWPGNVRELESVVERAVLLCENDRIDVEDFPPELRLRPTLLDRMEFELPNEGFSLEEFERQLLEKAMARNNGVIAKAAKMLGLSYKTMQYRLEKFQLGRAATSRMPSERPEEQNQPGG